MGPPGSAGTILQDEANERSRDLGLHRAGRRAGSPPSAWSCCPRRGSWPTSWTAACAPCCCGHEVGGLAETRHPPRRRPWCCWPTIPSWPPTARCPTPGSPSTWSRSSKPYIVLFGATPIGRDLAPRIASACRRRPDRRLHRRCRSAISSARARRYKDLLYQIRPAFGGNIIATIVNPEMHPQMATVREGVMKLGEPDPTRQGEIETDRTAASTSGDLALQVLEREIRAARPAT